MRDATRKSITGRRVPGFSLVELLVVIAIITLLVSILIPTLNRAKDLAKKAVCASNQKALGDALAQYAADNRHFFPPLTEQNGAAGIQKQDSNNWAHRFHTQAGSWWNLGYLWADAYSETPGPLYYCPSQPNKWFRYETYADPAFPQDVSNGTTTGVRITYYYNPTCTSTANRNRLYTNTLNMPPTAILLVDSLEGPSSVAHRQTSGEPGWEVLSGDCSVRFVIDPKVVDAMNASSNWTGSDYASFDTVIGRLTTAR